jgi:hypothetical protein
MPHRWGGAKPKTDSSSYFGIIKCDPELKSTLTTVQKLNGAEHLIKHVLKDGPIEIKNAFQFPFDAYWDATTRTIGVTPSEDSIYSLLFELHNASTQRQFDHYNNLAIQNKISKADFIRAIEYIEYQNTYKTAELVDEGIRQGLFPPNSRTPYHPEFEDHFCHQKLAGHSDWIGTIYDALTS